MASRTIRKGPAVYRLESADHPSLSAKIFQERDIPIQVAVGNYDLGVCSLDWIEELLAKYPTSNLLKIADLEYGKGNLYLAASGFGAISNLQDLSTMQLSWRIVSEYPNLAEIAALALRLKRFRIFPVWGAAEVYPPENADLALLWGEDESDLTAKSLIQLKSLLASNAFLIANRDSWQTKNLSPMVSCFNQGLKMRTKPWLQIKPALTKSSNSHRADLNTEKVWLALPDGHQQAPTTEFLNKAGLELQGYSEDKLDRRPISNLDWLNVKVIRPQDMPLQVANGNFDLAITGKDWLLDHIYRFPSSPVTDLVDLGFGQVKIVAVICQDSHITNLSQLKQHQADKPWPLRVASEYVNIADKYLRDNHGGQYKLIPTWGASEAFLPEDADLLIENTQTGKTLAKHNLRIMDEILQSTACLIGNKNGMNSLPKKEKLPLWLKSSDGQPRWDEMKMIEGFRKAKPLLSRDLPYSERHTPSTTTNGSTLEDIVTGILTDVRNKGDEALFRYTRNLDGAELKSLEVSKSEILSSYQKVDRKLVPALKLTADRIRQFHTLCKQRIEFSFLSQGLGRQTRPLDRVGIYVPGGTATYPSTVLMTAIPARIAGVREIIVLTPPREDGSIPAPTLVAADIARVNRIFKIGGAQAIAAMAFGTQSVPKVDKICGPGNNFVVTAKRMVYGTVDIESLPGPSEIVIVADDTADAALCAADLIAQAEHDPEASAILITTSAQLAGDVDSEIKKQLTTLERQATAGDSLNSRGMIVRVDSPDEAIELVNLYAPEHVSLMLRSATKYIPKIRNAGCIFVGANSPVALGDYVAGPSHVLPTGGSARFSSPLGIEDFLKITNIIALDKAAGKELGQAAITIAEAEGLKGHAQAIKMRL